MTPIEELLERDAIKNVRIMYSHYFDMGALDNLASLFSEDAICEFGPEYGGDWVGREAIKEGYSAFVGEPFTGAMHANTNPWIELTGEDTAKGRWYLLDLSLSDANQTAMTGLLGIYDDVYRKINGKWLIERTRIDFVWPRREYYGPR